MKTIHIVLIILVVVVVGVVISTISDSSTYVTFAEAAKRPDKEFHVIGTLSPGKELIYDAENNPNEFIFYMLDQDGAERKIVYRNAKPQDFERSEQVVIIGLVVNDTVFEAKSLLLKCPSKYNDENKPEKFGEKQFGSQK
ncbi:MAG: cytochrome c maturation protein CcmE [Bacteroidetes bacterium]|nr:MAG: cytochrome c maturation protein CcmE [Bacteroidota bacterium]